MQIQSNREPRIVFWDIETLPDLQQALVNWCDLAPMRAMGPKPTMSASVNSMCSFGYRIFGESKSVGVNAWDFPKRWKRNVNDDREICAIAAEVLNQSDAVVTFNGKRFDTKFLQTRLAIHKMQKLKKLVQIDLCQVSRENFFLLNNRLKTVAQYLLDDNKLEHDGWPLWVKVHGGVWPHRVRCRPAEQKMGKYNVKDVDLMVPLFKELRPMIKNIPNYNLFAIGEKKLCPSCGSTRLKSNGLYYTKTTVRRSYRCVDCSAYHTTDAKDRLPRS